MRQSTDGRCFLKAGWRYCGVSGSGLLILEKGGESWALTVMKDELKRHVAPGTVQETLFDVPAVKGGY